MKNYFSFKQFKDGYLLTNDTGKYCFLSPEDFDTFVRNENALTGETKKKLIDNYFTYNVNDNVFAEMIKQSIRGNKSYLFKSTSLHIFVLTNTCNLQCEYCQAKDEKCITPHMMDFATAEKCVDFALSSPSRFMTFEFQGGEPLVSFDVLRHIVEYTEENKGGKIVSYSVVSNLTLLSDEILDFLKKNNISISTSLDGPKNIHDKNRPHKNGLGSYDDVKIGINTIKNAGMNVGAIQTTTKSSLNFAKEIIDEYVSLGQKYLFIRPLTCLGTAARVWDKIGYSSDEFLQFYKQCLDYLILQNINGRKICERHATIFLKKILHSTSENYMELRSPCGASIGQLAYFYDGKVFTCDEARMLFEMGNNCFLLGNVFENSYDDIINSNVCKSTCVASLLESQAKCCDCVYQPYCGTCPVINLAQEKDIFMKNINSYRCKIYSGMLDIIFSKLIFGKDEEKEVLESWVKNDEET